MDVSINSYNRNYAYGHSGRVVVALWRGRTTADAVEKGWKLVNSRANSALLLTIIEARAALPDRDALAQLARFLAVAQARVSRSAAVIEAEGFRGATIRALISGLALLAKPAFPHRVFADVASAAEFLAGKPDSPQGAVDVAQILHTVDEVRRHPAKAPNFAWRQRPSEAAGRHSN